MTKFSSIMIALMALHFCTIVEVNAQFEIVSYTVDGGGGVSSGGGFSVSGTVGQPDAGQLSGGPFTLNGGLPNDPFVLGDVNGDGIVNLLDVAPFVEAIANGNFIAEADINQDGAVNLLDVDPFVDLLSGG